MRKTALTRLVIVGRDASSANGALTNLHTCIAKLEKRTRSIGGSADTFLASAINNTAMDLERAKCDLGAVLGRLDQVKARIDDQWRRIIRENRAAREAVRNGRV